jgi:hypothetical protein
MPGVVANSSNLEQQQHDIGFSRTAYDSAPGSV